MMATYGWEVALWCPAVLTLFYGGAMMAVLKPSPAAAGTPPAAAATAASAAQKPAGPGFGETVATLFKMPSFLCLCFAYIPIMLIRMSFTNWTAVMFLDRSMTLVEAAASMSAMELGGFFGSLGGGFVSDKLFQGRRGPVMCTFSLALVPCVLAFEWVAAADEAAVVALCGGLAKIVVLQAVFFLTGFFSFPPHSLIGLMSREIVPEQTRSTAGCLAKAVGQFGAALAGWPLERFSQSYGWGAVGMVHAGCGVAAAVIFSPLWNTVALAKEQKKA
jgi:sugar phosphate permease